MYGTNGVLFILALISQSWNILGCSAVMDTEQAHTIPLKYLFSSFSQIISTFLKIIIILGSQYSPSSQVKSLNDSLKEVLNGNMNIMTIWDFPPHPE